MSEESKYERGIHYNVLNQRFTLIEDTLEMWDKYKKLDNKFRKLLEELITGNIVIEIGPGSSPQTSLFQFNPKEYICVEPTPRRGYQKFPDFFRYVESEDMFNGPDGLSYLETVPDNSVVVLSSGVFDNFILPNKEYVEKLVETIYQKTIPGGLTFHTFEGNHKPIFPLKGFELELVVQYTTEITMEEGLFKSKKPNLIMVPAFFRKPE